MMLLAVGHMKCWLRNGCPVVKERNKHLGPRLAGESFSEEVVKWWAERFPEVPSRVVQYMAGEDSIPQVRICPGIVGFVAGLPMPRV